MSKRQTASLEGYREDIRQLEERSSDSVALLPISLGQEYHKGELMLSTLETLGKIFSNVVIIIADELQAYNDFIKNNILFSDEQLDNYRQQLLAKSQQWQIEYKQEMDACLESYEIKTWREFLDDENFTEAEDFILTLYNGLDGNLNSNESRFSNYKKIYQTLTEKEYKGDSIIPANERFKSLITSSAKKKGSKNTSKELRKSMSIKYIIEECIVYIQWIIRWKLPGTFLIYPSDINPAIEYLKRNFNSTLTHLNIKFTPQQKVPFTPEVPFTPKTRFLTRSHSRSDSLDSKSETGERRSSSPISLPNRHSLLVSVPREYHAKNIALVKLAFQKNLLELIELAASFNRTSNDKQIQSTISSFLKRMAMDIPIITDDQDKSSLGELPNVSEKIRGFLAFVFLDMKLIAERVQNPDHISCELLEHWCQKLNGYIDSINELIDNVNKTDELNPEPESLRCLDSSL